MVASSMTITTRDNDCEVKNCCLADGTGTIQLSIWDSQIDMVEAGRSYSFTNLTTRKFNDKTTLTTTHSSTITPLHKKIPTPTADSTETLSPALHIITTDIAGAAIIVKKQCPKCHTAQQNLSSKDKFHRCNACKILRKGTSYVTKFSGFLSVVQNDSEVSLTITNSLVTRFVSKQQDLSVMDSLDIGEFFMTCAPLTISCTDENQIIHLYNTTHTSQDQNATQDDHNSDRELCAL